MPKIDQSENPIFINLCDALDKEINNKNSRNITLKMIYNKILIFSYLDNKEESYLLNYNEEISLLYISYKGYLLQKDRGGFMVYDDDTIEKTVIDSKDKLAERVKGTRNGIIFPK